MSIAFAVSVAERADARSATKQFTKTIGTKSLSRIGGTTDMCQPFVSTLKQYRHNGEKWAFVFPQNPKAEGLCKVIYCRRPAQKSRYACATCRSRLYRANNPAKEIYRQIKDRAQRRNQVFTLTFAEFMEAIEGTEYLERRGTGITELHLDRIKVEKGYVAGNVKVITCAENLAKQHEVDYAEGPF